MNCQTKNPLRVPGIDCNNPGLKKILYLENHLNERVIGQEEEKIIKPTLKKLFEAGNMVFGPFSADGFLVRLNMKNMMRLLQRIMIKD